MKLSSRRTALFLFLLIAGWTLPGRADEPLPGTRPLTIEGDLALQMIDGIDRFLLKKTAESVAKRAAFWKRDLSSPEAYVRSVEPDRKRLAHILGVRDPRVPFDAPSLVGTTAQPALVGKADHFDVFAIRWPAFGDVHGEGLLLVPTGRPIVADVVAIPDADQTPEQIAGLVPGVPLVHRPAHHPRHRQLPISSPAPELARALNPLPILTIGGRSTTIGSTHLISRSGPARTVRRL